MEEILTGERVDVSRINASPIQACVLDILYRKNNLLNWIAESNFTNNSMLENMISLDFFINHDDYDTFSLMTTH